MMQPDFRPPEAKKTLFPPPLYFGKPPAPGRLKLIDAGRKLVVTNCDGSYVISQLLSLLHSFSARAAMHMVNARRRDVE